jgi:hypothetical protein
VDGGIELIKDEIDAMQMDILQSNQVLRAFRQAPWRVQTQTLAMFSIGILIMLVVGGLYLSVASRAGNAGRDLQRYEALQQDLIRENDRLRATLADMRNMDRMAARALSLGFAPATPEQVHYVQLDEFPYTPAVAPANTGAAVLPATADEAAAIVADQLPANTDWLTTALSDVYVQLFGEGGGR